MAAAYQSGAVDPTTATSDTSMVVTAPTGIAVGDQLTAFGGCVASRTIAPPSGWTEQLNNSDGTNRVYVWTRTADSADTSATDYTFTASGNFNSAIVSVHRADGVDTGTAPTVGNSTGPNDQVQTCPTITAPAAGSLFLWWLYGGNNTTATADKGTERTDAGNGTSGCHMAAYSLVEAGTGSITGATITTGAFGAKRIVSVAFGPSGGGGAAATRGMPFGGRGTAFNGGRTFTGIIRREWLRAQDILRMRVEYA